MRILYIHIILILTFCAITSFADKTYSINKKANKLYEKGKYEEALKLYDQALLESPKNQKLKMNKGSAHYKLNDFQRAEESYKEAEGLDNNKRTQSALHYNMGNIFFRQGQLLEMQGNPSATEKYKSAVEQYIKALEAKPKDRDAKWNLQLAQLKIQNLQNQQQNQQHQDNQQNQQDKNQQNQNNPNQQNQNNNKEKDKDGRNEQQQNNPNQNNNKEEDDRRDTPQPQQSATQNNMEAQEAARLIEQFADDEKELNKPRKAAIKKEAMPEKDW